jgi:hypothetical protein
MGVTEVYNWAETFVMKNEFTRLRAAKRGSPSQSRPLIQPKMHSEKPA